MCNTNLQKTWLRTLKIRYVAGLASVLVIMLCPPLHAEVSLPRLLSDGVVLQRDTANRIWGWAAEGETVSVKFDGQEAGTVVAENGEWQVLLEPVSAGGPHLLEINGTNQLEISDVYFGEVWVASGQSNMQLPMERVKQRYPDEISGANNPLIRMFTVPRDYDLEQPQADVDSGEWNTTIPQNILEFSATAYFFAKDLNQDLGVPVGIISSNYGGSTAEGWMSEEALAEYPHFLEKISPYRDRAYLDRVLEADKENEDNWHRNIDMLDAGLTGSVKWFDDSHDISTWDKLVLPAIFEDEDLASTSGVIWLKREFTLPASAAGKPGQLMLGAMVDADTTYVNGVEVGNITYRYPPRLYTINENLLREGINTITVRLTCNAGNCGFITDKPYRLQTGDTTIELGGPWAYRVGVKTEPMRPAVFNRFHQPMGFYNAMLAPLLKTSIRGVIWYQGESNVSRAEEYTHLFPAMIRDWRKQWGIGDFPFIYVQLANYLEAQEQPVESAWAELRDAQLSTLAVPNTAMAVTIDVGEWNDIHPLNK
jgi:sialate O-acetylesterase